jgi:hypothetical protein
VSRHIPYPGSDTAILVANNSTEAIFIEPYQQGIFGKKINYSDTIKLARRIDWVSNTVYSRYDNIDGALLSKSFYVNTTDGSNFFIYKCLDNNNGAPSIIIPTDADESACNFSTSDGYVWKLMYKMSNTAFFKFATSDHMPVETSANVSYNTIPGAIDVISVETPGSDYISSLTGTFFSDDLRSSIPAIAGSSTTYRLANSASANVNFYTGSALYITSGSGFGGLRKITAYDPVHKVVQIDSPFTLPPASGSSYLIAPHVSVAGDGTNAEGYADVSSNATVNNFISKVQIIDRGKNYTYATATISGNTGGISNNATLRVIIPPKGGHGHDSELELGATSLGISMELSGSENGFVPVVNDYRSIFILKDPLFNNVGLETENPIGTFLGNEDVLQVSYMTLTGNGTVATDNTTITGTGTEFYDSLNLDDEIILFDPINNTRCLRKIVSVSNSTTISINSAPSFSSSIAKIQVAERISKGIRTGGDSSYVIVGNAEPRFVLGKNIIGAVSGAWGNVTNITINDAPFNEWKTFDNRTRIAYSFISGALPQDAQIYQVDISIANAYFHSANSTYLFLTDEKGILNPDLTDKFIVSDSITTITAGPGTKYYPDLVKGSGKVMYVENVNPISRSNGQAESISVTLNF